MAPPPTQPLAKLDTEAHGRPSPARRSTAADLLQEKYNVKVCADYRVGSCAYMREIRYSPLGCCCHVPHTAAPSALAPRPPRRCVCPAGGAGERERQGGDCDCVRAGGDEPADGRPAPARQPVREAGQPGGRQAGVGEVWVLEGCRGGCRCVCWCAWKMNRVLLRAGRGGTSTPAGAAASTWPPWRRPAHLALPPRPRRRTPSSGG